MKRIPEPELMDEREQALAYANADFSEPHSRFVDLFQERFSGRRMRGTALDLGCGPGDVACRFAARFPEIVVHGVDASAAMLEAGKEVLQRHGISQRVQLMQGYLPQARLPLDRYDAVISNSLLHHLADPATLWESALRCGKPGAPLFVMDLMRPPDAETAERLARLYVDNEPELLKRDFRLSLLASYTTEEVLGQLQRAGLAEAVKVETVSDRHFIVWGDCPGS